MVFVNDKSTPPRAGPSHVLQRWVSCMEEQNKRQCISGPQQIFLGPQIFCSVKLEY